MREWSMVSITDISSIWPALIPFVEKSCKRGGGKYAPDDYLSVLMSGKAQLWITNGAAALTDIVEYPRKRYARITMGLGKNPHDIHGLLASVEEWAKINGCCGVESTMRLGFEVSFRERNYTKTQILMEKEL